MQSFSGLSLWEVVNSNIDVQIDESALGIWERACAYFLWCDENPVKWKSGVSSGVKAGTLYFNESPHPYSVKEFCVFCNLSESYISFVRNTKDQNSEFYLVISKILSIIYVQNLNYAVTGVYNAMFTAKLLSVGEDVSVPEPVKVEIVTQNIPELSSSENEVLEKLEMEKSFLDLDKDAKEAFKKAKRAL